MKSSPNYLVLLVHGIGSRGEAFGYGERDIRNSPPKGLKHFLEKNLGLNGYVYSYSFSNPLQSSITSARELGDRNYYLKNPAGQRYQDLFRHNKINTNLCMLDKAKEDFKKYFNSKYKRNPQKAEIPDKFIIICHSMGGLAARYYLTSGFYKNDINKIIFLDTPHLGSDGMVWYERFKMDFGIIRAFQGQYLDYGMKIIMDSVLKTFGSPQIESVYVAAANMTLSMGSNYLDDILINSVKEFGKEKEGWKLGGAVPTSKIIKNIFSVHGQSLLADYFKQIEGSWAFWILLFANLEGDGLNEMHPDSSFLSELRTATA
ncbi:MAG: hypothetical protein HQ564_01450 [Candidatus Saganbacteria bacterium]|nr:hypothetical protein [Candidatus Saganbacteria bacterium]